MAGYGAAQVARDYYRDYASDYMLERKEDGYALERMEGFGDALGDLGPYEAVKYAYHGRGWKEGAFNPYADWYVIEGGYPVSVTEEQFEDYYDGIIDADDFVSWLGQKGYLR